MLNNGFYLFLCSGFSFLTFRKIVYHQFMFLAHLIHPDFIGVLLSVKFSSQ
jgi:hypothetical protein